MDSKERINVIITGMIILLTVMALGFGVLAMWIRELRTEIASMELDYQAGDEALHARMNDVNEDLLEVQSSIPEMYMDISEVRSIIKNTNSALTRTNKQIRKEQKQEEPTTEASPKSSIKDETMHEVFTAEETTQIDQAVEEVESASESETPSGMTSLGVWEISAYEETGNCTASGTYPTAWHTCAINAAPLGATIYISDLGYFVNEDYCGTPSRCDIYLGSVEDCYSFGLQYHEVFIVN